MEGIGTKVRGRDDERKRGRRVDLTGARAGCAILVVMLDGLDDGGDGVVECRQSEHGMEIASIRKFGSASSRAISHYTMLFTTSDCFSTRVHKLGGNLHSSESVNDITSKRTKRGILVVELSTEPLTSPSRSLIRHNGRCQILQ